MNTKPLVSIIIPTFNQHESFLRECIESATNQTYQHIEIIISDNHSTNGASEIIADYAQKDSRIRIVKPPQFVSLVENFSFAYNKAIGEFICPLSSDDILYPQIVEELLKPFSDYPGLSFSYSIPLYFSTDISKAKWIPDELDTGFYTTTGFVEVYIKRRHCSWGGILFKTSDFHKMGGFSKDVNYAADTDAIIKLLLLGEGVYCINKPLSAIRQWERTEHVNRTPFVLAEVAEIFYTMENRIKDSRITLNKNVISDAKRVIFSREVFPIAYFTVFKKRDADIIDKTAAVIQANYPTGLFNFIVKNRKNIIGLFFSFGYLGLNKLKFIFKH